MSHAIRKLEYSLGVVLFEREGRIVRLSADGMSLMRHVGPAFADIRRGLDLVSTRGPRLLRVHSAPSFAAQWLTPRLPRFLAAHREIDIRLAAGTDYARFTTDEFDVDIVYGRPNQSDLVVLPLGEETVTPLCTPRLAEAIATPKDLLAQVLIESDNKQIRWRDWFEANRLAAPPPQGIRFDRSFLAIAAAASGLGVALESTRLAEREIKEGILIAPLGGRAFDVHYIGHFLVFPRPAQRREALQKFIQWIGVELALHLLIPSP